MRRTRRRGRHGVEVPRFALYGEADTSSPLQLHIEDIQKRSRLYQWDISPHLHGGLYQIVAVLSGPVKIALEESQRDPTQPVAIVIPPGVVHAFHFAPETEGYVLTLNTNWAREAELQLDEACRTLFAKPRLLLLESEDSAGCGVAGLLRELISEFRQPDGPASPVTGWLARAVVWRLAQRVTSEAGEIGKSPQHANFMHFRLLLERHYAEHWSVAHYAQAMNLTVERLNRLCKQQTGVTAFELARQRILQEACRRLIYIVVPVTQLAYELGFEDAAYFCRFFKRHTGISPMQYRKRHSGYELNELA